MKYLICSAPIQKEVLAACEKSGIINISPLYSKNGTLALLTFTQNFIGILGLLNEDELNEFLAANGEEFVNDGALGDERIGE